jgi:hypothetical protein
VKREKLEPLIDDVVLCVQMGWTHGELMRQPVRFVEKLQIYLDTLADKQDRERHRLEEEIERMRRRGR